MKTYSAATWVLVALCSFPCTLAAPKPKAPWVKSHGNPWGNSPSGRRSMPRSVPIGSTYIPTTAPLPNIFQGLSDYEAVGVTEFLHRQPELNLTAAANATSWDNLLTLVEYLAPNKTDALPFLEKSGAAAPDRYAKATIIFRMTEEPYVQEFMVGPLPVANGTTTYAPLDYIYNKGVGKQRVYNADDDLIREYTANVSASIEDILLDLFNGTASGKESDTMYITGMDPLWHENGTVVSWQQFWNSATSIFDDSTLLPLGLYFKLNITGRNPDGWGVMGWYYNGIFYDTTEDFRAAWNSSGFEKLGVNVDSPHGHTDWNGEELPYDTIVPPVAILPSDPRYKVDVEEQYVEWMDFSFYISHNRDTGVALHNIKYKGERIIYELSLQEALAHYASSDPTQSGTSYLDSYYGFGPFTFELVSGFDCPAYSTFLNTSYYVRETTRTHPNSICLFEFEKDYPIQRHSTMNYVSVTRNVMFVLRSVATIGNYDYQFSYEFYLDGAVKVIVRASGYIQSAYWAHNGDYGFKIHDNLSGSMHDHVLNFKLDLDVNGTANSLVKTEFVPTTETYPWSNGVARNTMKIDRTFITNEDQGKLNWAPNSAATYTVINKDNPNPYGEYRGWKITPAIGPIVHLTVENSTNVGKSVGWATHHLYALKQKDTEPRSAYAYNSLDVNDPVVDFNKFFDGESLEQEDLVLYFNLGTHHVPDTSDLPNTVFTSAQSGIAILPQNYLLGDPSRATRQQVRVDYESGNVSVNTFGHTTPAGVYDLSRTTTDLTKYVGDVVVRKFPYDPDNWYYIGDQQMRK